MYQKIFLYDLVVSIMVEAIAKYDAVLCIEICKADAFSRNLIVVSAAKKVRCIFCSGPEFHSNRVLGASGYLNFYAAAVVVDSFVNETYSF